MLMPRFGMDVVLAHPPEYSLMPETVEAAFENAGAVAANSAWWTAWTRLSSTPMCDPQELGLPGHHGAKPEESLRIAKQYTGWICDAERMKLARRDVLYMHPLPADRGNEVTDEVIDGPELRGVPGGGKPSAYGQGDHGAHHGRRGNRIRAVAVWLRRW